MILKKRQDNTTDDTPASLMTQAFRYQTDRWARSVLFLDILRERANNMLAHEDAGMPAPGRNSIGGALNRHGGLFTQNGEKFYQPVRHHLDRQRGQNQTHQARHDVDAGFSQAARNRLCQ